MTTELRLFAIPGIPEVQQGADIAALICEAASTARMRLDAGDVIVVAQKIVSKAEGAVMALDAVTPSSLAAEWASVYGREAAVVEIVLRESRRIVRMDRGVIISETRHGFVCANAGVDASNVPPGYVTILPHDPDLSAERIRSGLVARLGHRVATIVSDTFGRPWREGVVNVALGVAGLTPLLDCRGITDQFGRRLHSTVLAIADEIASAAELVMGKTAGMPVVVVRGASEWIGEGRGAALVRPAQTDMFR